MLFQKPLFYLGWTLLLLAFASGAAEAGARLGGPAAAGLVVSTHELLLGLVPEKYLAAQQTLGASGLWSPLFELLFELPAWLILGGLGALTAFSFRPNQEISDEEREDFKEYEAQLFLFDDLAAEARREGYTEGDDRLPDHRGFEPWDEVGFSHADGLDGYAFDLASAQDLGLNDNVPDMDSAGFGDAGGADQRP